MKSTRIKLLLSAFALLLSGLLSGCMTTSKAVDNPIYARFFIEDTNSNGFSALATLPISGVKIGLQPKAVISEFDYASIDEAEIELGKCLVFRLKRPAARDFYQLTVGNQGKRLALLLNGKAVGARRIERPIASGEIYMFLEVTDEELSGIAAKLKETNLDIQKKLSR